jgi:inner membrane protein
MDNLCHTLAGWALAEAGLKKRTPLGTAALLVAANVADVDGLAYFKGTLAALCFRRGLTHGIVATAFWPFLLAGLFIGWDRAVRRRRVPGLEPARPGQLLLLSAIGVLSHPLLDLLNTYGVRLLSPLSQRWFYGDALFIVDPWMWLLLGGGAALSRRAERRGASGGNRPARLGLGLAATYAATMLVGGHVVERRVAEELASRGHPVVSVLAAPLPVTPLRRKILADLGDAYALGEWTPLSRPAISFSPRLLPKTNDAASAAKAAGTEAARRFLSWSRYPVYETLPDGSVRISDLRFRVRGLNWATLRVLPPPESGR